jgi:hypothetical protein
VSEVRDEDPYPPDPFPIKWRKERRKMPFLLFVHEVFYVH